MSLFEEASRYIAGGVNSPVRAFRGVGGEPLFIRRARGASIETEDGRRLIDYVGSWGPMILGHADPDVIAAVTRRAADGLSFGAPTVIETELARRIVELVPSIERAAHGELRHRGDDERDPPRARIHRPRPHRQVRGLLPRPRRRAAGEGGLGRADARRAGFGRACRPRSRPRRRRCPTTTPPRSSAASPRRGARSPASSSSPWPATWAACRPRRVSSRRCARTARATARC